MRAHAVLMALSLCCLIGAPLAGGEDSRSVGYGISPPFHLKAYGVPAMSLSLDPNPEISEIMPGGTFLRYYRVVDSTGGPLEGVEVKVLVDGRPYYLSSREASCACERGVQMPTTWAWTLGAC